MNEGLASIFSAFGLVRLPDGRWRIAIPDTYNMAEALVSTHARGPLRDSIAVTIEDEDGVCRSYSYGVLEARSDALAGWMSDRGVVKGDVVAVHTGQSVETIISHLAAYKIGAIVATMSQLYGPDTLGHILRDSGAKLVITQDAVWNRFRAARDEFSAVETCVVVGKTAGEEIGFDACCEQRSAPLQPVATKGTDPALLIYTSGSTGMPKGIVHGHRILPAYIPTLALFYNLELRDAGLVFWTPADWAWIGGFVDVVFPSLFFGHRLVASQRRFETEWALDFMARHGVTHSLMTPTALRRLAQTQNPKKNRDLKLRTVFTGGEALPGETLNWLHEELGIVCNEGYGMSEVNHMIGNCQKLRPIKPGSMGWNFPGHVAALVDEDGAEVPDGEPGEIVTSPDDPTLFLGYWKKPELTEAIRLGPWVRTRDLAVRDDEGYYWYRGRNDDLIKSAGYRIGPAEIEEVLAQHPAVAEAAVIGSPDADRGQIVKAFIKLAGGWNPGEDLIAALQTHVKERLAAYKYPRSVVFVPELPTTSTGKISRAELRRRDLAAGRS